MLPASLTSDWSILITWPEYRPLIGCCVLSVCITLQMPELWLKVWVQTPSRILPDLNFVSDQNCNICFTSTGSICWSLSFWALSYSQLCALYFDLCRIVSGLIILSKALSFSLWMLHDVSSNHISALNIWCSLWNSHSHQNSQACVSIVHPWDRIISFQSQFWLVFPVSHWAELESEYKIHKIQFSWNNLKEDAGRRWGPSLYTPWTWGAQICKTCSSQRWFWPS